MRPFVHSTIQTTCARGATEERADLRNSSPLSPPQEQVTCEGYPYGFG